MKNPVLPIVLLAVISITSYSQTTKPLVTRYGFQTNNQVISYQPVDTALSGSQNHAALSTTTSWSDLGNTGLPALINQYRPVRDAFNPLMFEGIDGYGANESELVFIRAKSPYTLLNYNSGGTADKNGQTIRAQYARNLKSNGNLTIFGNYYNSEGHFSTQKANSSSIKANYLLNRKNYRLVAGLSRLSFGFSENGGLRSDADLSGTGQPEYLPVNLSGAVSKMSSLTFQGVQSANISLSRHRSAPPAPVDSIPKDSLAPKNITATPADTLPVPPTDEKFLSVRHLFRISNISRKYTDTKNDASFYQNTYSENLATKDSVSFLSWTNSIDLLTDTIHLLKLPFIASGGVNPDFYRYQQTDTISYGYALGLNGKIEKKDSLSGMELSATWTAAGYSAGDYKIRASYSQVLGKKTGGPELSLELYAKGSTPDPILSNYSSNHFRWTNDFSRTNEAGAKLKFGIPKIATELNAGIVTNKGWIYFDGNGFPAQLTTGMTVFSAGGTKEFVAGVFRSSVTALIQYSTSDKIRLPLFTGITSTYIHHDIRFPATLGELQVEYGFDLRYSTPFYGYSYMPATGIFFAQDEKLLGNYPGLNVFAQIKVKRTRVFVQWCETFADLLPEQSFAVLHYPSMRPHLKYGIYWHFYD